MARRLIIPLLFVFVAASSLCAGQLPVTLCIVQTKADQAMRYDPSAGPWAIRTYNYLYGKKLRDGSSAQRGLRHPGAANAQMAEPSALNPESASEASSRLR